MSTDTMGELRAKALTHIMRVIAEGDGPKPASQAGLSKVAAQKFDDALKAARAFHTEHPEEDADVHMSHLMQVFQDIGIPPLETLPIVSGLVLSNNKEQPDEAD